MKDNLIGREKEKEILLEALASEEAEMVSVIGRRRVGKTFLVRSVYQDAICLEIEGIQNAPRKEQLKDFTIRLNRAAKLTKKIKAPTNWLDAFYLLIDYLEELGKKVVFFDELPWLATHKSGFLRALGMFWNSWASRNNIVVVICGSAASWFYNATLTLDKNIADGLREKMRIFQDATKTNKQLFWGLITTFGLHPNQHSIGLIQQVIQLEELFE